MKMKKIGRICLAAAALMLVLFTAMPVSAQTKWEKAGYAQITAPTALRSVPNDKTYATLIRILPAGAVVNIISVEDDGWYKVAYGSRTGYVMEAYFTSEDDVEPYENAVYRVVSVDLPLRSSPKILSNNIITTINARKQVEVVGERSDNWVHVLFDDQYGYIPNGFFASDAGNGKGYSYKYLAENAYVRSSTKYLTTNTVALLKTGKRVKVVGSSGNWYRISYNGNTRYMKAGYFTVDTRTSYVTETIARSINLRKKASTSSTALKVLSPGTVVKVYAETSKNWYKIKSGGKTGYVIGGYFSSDRTQSNPTEDEIRITTADLRMHTGAGVDYPIVTVIPNGSVVTLLSQKGNWYRVRYYDGSDSYNGWVYGTYLARLDTVDD